MSSCWKYAIATELLDATDVSSVVGVVIIFAHRHCSADAVPTQSGYPSVKQ